jgi:hypothetical protein
MQMRKFRTGVAIAALIITAPAMADDCADILAFNDKTLNRLEMKEMPCHCIPMSGRMGRVHKTPPPGMTCGMPQGMVMQQDVAVTRP